MLSSREPGCGGTDRAPRHVSRVYAGHRTQTREDAGRALSASRGACSGVLGRWRQRAVFRRGREELAAGKTGTDQRGPVRLWAGTDCYATPENMVWRMVGRDHEDALREADEPPRRRRRS